ncbi:uncharacterized protein VTP21DRAFT_4253 [Calcarisporiella thermophila]|uniref:uncharacterized protein n=1 Tax=Calcarisporiella thermophila TaxID=911321 RepID=UPI0037427B3B
MDSSTSPNWFTDSSQLPETKTFIGVIVAVAGNILISIALNVQKYAHNKLLENKHALRRLSHSQPREVGSGEASPQSPSSFEYFSTDEEEVDAGGYQSFPNESRPLLHHRASQHSLSYGMEKRETNYLKSKLWWLGLLLMSLGEIGNFLAYGFSPASVVAPLGIVTMISNVLLAPLMLKERYRIRDMIGILIAICGAVVVVTSARSEETHLSPELIAEALLQTRFLLYVLITTLSSIFLAYLSNTIGHKLILVDLSLVALFGAFTVLATKGLSSLLSLRFVKMFTYPITYLLIFVLIVTAIFQIKYLNKSLQRFEATQVIPTQFVTFTLSAIIGSAVLYGDFDDIDARGRFVFVCGCAMTFVGVYLITSNREKRVERRFSLSGEDAGAANVVANGLKVAIGGNTVLADGLALPGTPSLGPQLPRSIPSRLPPFYRAAKLPRPNTTYALPQEHSVVINDEEDDDGAHRGPSSTMEVINALLDSPISTASILALESIGARHTTALGFGQVWENYLVQREAHSGRTTPYSFAGELPSGAEYFDGTLQPAARRGGQLPAPPPQMPAHVGADHHLAPHMSRDDDYLASSYQSSSFFDFPGSGLSFRGTSSLAEPSEAAPAVGKWSESSSFVNTEFSPSHPMEEERVEGGSGQEEDPPQLANTVQVKG